MGVYLIGTYRSIIKLITDVLLWIWNTESIKSSENYVETEYWLDS